jgi:alpha-ribazole phosphatase
MGRKLVVYLVRHGETAMNRRGLLQGQRGFGLNARGRAESRCAARALAGKGVTLVTSSDLRRARETAAILRAALGVRAPVRLSRALREIDFGRLTGISEREMERRCPPYRTDPAHVFPGGESYALVQARALRWLRRLARRRSGVVAAVTHGGLLRSLLAALEGVPLARTLGESVPHGLVGRVEVGTSTRLFLARPLLFLA